MHHDNTDTNTTMTTLELTARNYILVVSVCNFCVSKLTSGSWRALECCRVRDVDDASRG